jgi:hypothetical protein
VNGAHRAYIQAHCHAVAMLSSIEEMLHDLPAPDDEEQSINWEHVGTVNEVISRLRATVEFMEGREH